MGSHPHPHATDPTDPRMPPPTTTPGTTGLAALLAAPGTAVVALDFDGTLADIVPDPEQARAHPGVVAALAALAPHVASVVVITGRPAAVAVEYGGFVGVPGLDGLVVLGHYGLERWDAATGEVRTPEPHPGIVAARAELPDILAASGVEKDTWIEEKGQAFAVHTRRAANPAAAFDVLRGPLAKLAERHELALEPGRMVLELRPPGIDKGVALTDHVHDLGATTVLYAGDDLGDLPAFAAVADLRRAGLEGLLLCSGTETEALATAADLVLDGPAAVTDYLAALAEALG